MKQISIFDLDQEEKDNHDIVAIIDADLIGRKKHRFPNLACEKISAYWKDLGFTVELKTDYDNLDTYFQVYISKVFTDTPFPDNIKETSNIHLGGTGFYFDKAPNLPSEIEHHQPDYHLYDQWVEEAISQGNKPNEFKEYLDYSIGFMTRGCFRKCPFCVNQKYNKVFAHSTLSEFMDQERKKICLLDDNFFGYANWKELLQELIDTKKPFKFKQGLDERLLNDDKCKMLFSSKYDGDFTFAFDNVEDYDLINSKLKLIRKYTTKENIKFYVLVGFKSTDIEDIENAFIRISLLMKYRCLPYIMRYQSATEKPYMNSEFKDMYNAITRWCNQPSMFKKKSFREYCYLDQSSRKNTVCPAMRMLKKFENEYPDIAEKYFDLKFGESKGE